MLSYMTIILKNILPFAIISVFIFLFIYSTSVNQNTIEVTVKTPELNNRNVVLKLINEFDDITEVVHVETSIQTNTFMIVYSDSYNFSQNQVRDIFSKWGCDNLEISYALVN